MSDKELITEVANLIRNMASINATFEITNAEVIADVVVKYVKHRKPPVDYFQEGFNAWHRGLKERPKGMTADQHLEWNRGWGKAMRESSSKSETGD